MTQLSDLVDAIEREYAAATAQATRAALFYLQRSYEEGFAVGERDLRSVLGNDVGRFRPDPRRVEFVSRYSFEAIKDIERLGVERTREVFLSAIADATMDVRDVKRLLEARFFGIVDQQRLPWIARTETNRAGNVAKVDRYKATGVTHHEALTAGDGRVRDGITSDANHTRVDGQVRRIGEPFDVPRGSGGASAHSNYDRHPPFDPNCRCTVIPVLPDNLAESAIVKLSLTREERSRRLAAWHRSVGGYAEAWLHDLRRTYRTAFDAALRHIDAHAQLALVEARQR